MMIDKLREFVNKSAININVGSVVLNRDLTVLAVSDVVAYWLECKPETLLKQKFSYAFPELGDYDTLLKHLMVKNDPRLSIQLSDISRPILHTSANQIFHFEARCAPRPGFIMLTMSTENRSAMSPEIERHVQERTAELVQANLLLEWENERLRQRKLLPQTGNLDLRRFYPRIGFGR